MTKHEEEVKARYGLVAPLPGALADPPKAHGKSKGKKAHVAIKKKKGKKGKKK